MPRPNLKPARTDLDEQHAYMPRIPWKWIALAVLGVGTVVAGFQIKEQRRADQLRAQIVRVHEQELDPVSNRVLAFRSRLDALVVEAGTREPARFIDDRLKLSGLRSGQGLYLRLSAKDVASPKDIARGAATMNADAITRCLGITATSARALYERAGFLEPEWLEERRNEESVMKLRVADEMLAQRIRSDLPAILGMLDSDWFMLVIQQGENRRDHPVDVFLWDLRREQKLLSARIQARGALMPTRIRAQGKLAGAPVNPEQLRGAGAHDCSIASQIKAMDGFPAPEISSTLPHELTAGDTPGPEETPAVPE